MFLIHQKRPTAGRRRKPIWRLYYWLVIIPATGWAVSVLWLAQPPTIFRMVVIVLSLLGALLPPLLLRPAWFAALVSGAPFACVLIWFFSLAPSNNRDWQPDLAILPWAEIKVVVSGDQNRGSDLGL